MKFRMLIAKVLGAGLLSMMLLSCKKLPKEVEVVDRRELSKYDDPMVFRAGYEALAGTQPLSWRKVNNTKFRLLNYAAGEATEIAVGESGGGLLPNLNRWLGEFGQDALENADGLELIKMLDGLDAKVIHLKGSFQKKLGGRAVTAEGWAVIGVICHRGGGNVLTVKMAGPEAEVEAQKENLINFAKSIRIKTLQTPSERSKKGAKVDKAEGSGY